MENFNKIVHYLCILLISTLSNNIFAQNCLFCCNKDEVCIFKKTIVIDKNEYTLSIECEKDNSSILSVLMLDDNHNIGFYNDEKFFKENSFIEELQLKILEEIDKTYDTNKSKCKICIIDICNKLKICALTCNGLFTICTCYNLNDEIIISFLEYIYEKIPNYTEEKVNEYYDTKEILGESYYINSKYCKLLAESVNTYKNDNLKTENNQSDIECEILSFDDFINMTK